MKLYPLFISSGNHKMHICETECIKTVFSIYAKKITQWPTLSNDASVIPEVSTAKNTIS